MAKWKQLADGTWVPNDSFSTGQPIVRGFTQGQAPAGFVHGPNPDRNRRYDKPNDAQIRSLMEEDEKTKKEAIGAEVAINDAKEGLRTGRIRVADEILRPQERKILPHAAVTDDRGITHIVPEDKVSVTIEKPTEGTLQSNTDMKQLQNMALDAVKAGKHRGRTFG